MEGQTAASEKSIRHSQSVCDGEQEYVEKRKQIILESLNSLEINCSADSVPHIALLASGGGQRAAVSVVGSLFQMGKDGLLDSVLYLGGISGSTWSMSSLYSDPQWSKGMDIAVSKLIHTEVKSEEVIAWLEERLKEEHFCLTDIWGVLTSATVMKQMELRRLSEEASRDATNPYPIYCAIEKYIEEATEGKWFEFSPHEAGFTELGLFVKTSLLGSKFQSGELLEEKPEMDMVKLQGIFGSALADFNKIIDYISNLLPWPRVFQAAKASLQRSDSPPPFQEPVSQRFMIQQSVQVTCVQVSSKSRVIWSKSQASLKSFFLGQVKSSQRLCQVKSSHFFSTQDPALLPWQMMKMLQHRSQLMKMPQHRSQLMKMPQHRSQLMKMPQHRSQLMKMPQHRCQMFSLLQHRIQMFSMLQHRCQMFSMLQHRIQMFSMLQHRCQMFSMLQHRIQMFNVEDAEASLPDVQFAATSNPDVEDAAASLPDVQFAAALLPDVEDAAASLPEDEYAAASLLEDEYAAASLPEDEYAASLPEDEYAAASLPEDEYAASLPEDEYAAASLFEDEYAAASLPDDEHAAADVHGALHELIALTRSTIKDPSTLSELDKLQEILEDTEKRHQRPTSHITSTTLRQGEIPGVGGYEVPKMARMMISSETSVEMGYLEKLKLGYSLAKQVFQLIWNWEWGTTNNFLYKYQDSSVPSLITTKEKLHLVDAGLLMNVPYPPFLGDKRDIDLIIAPDYSAGEIFKTLTLARDYAAKVKKPFPKIDEKILEEREWPKGCYVFEGKEKEPTIVYLPLFNRDNCKDAEQVKEKMSEFSTFQLPHNLDQEKIKSLFHTSRENMERNKETLLREINKAALRRYYRKSVFQRFSESCLFGLL
uniref:cytosolic phospholipase A2 gamma-like n=1 Tax=Semicossyphus pulcher TaxID=241346 RepID=UPI0037E860AB